MSNSVRGINMGGYTAPVTTENIEYYTLASLGDAKDFGELTVAMVHRSIIIDSYSMCGGMGSGGHKQP